MLYLGIDQHARQLTVSLRDEGGDVLLALQVTTGPDRVRAFFDQLARDRLGAGESFAAVLEVCGFNDGRIRLLHEYRCPQVVRIQPAAARLAPIQAFGGPSRGGGNDLGRRCEVRAGPKRGLEASKPDGLRPGGDRRPRTI